MADDEVDVLSITVVICAFSTPRWSALRAAVASVAAEPVQAEVVVVIDHNPELLELARGDLVGATVVASDGRPGLSGARNTGLRHASRSIVAFLDDDAAGVPGWLERFRDHYADPAVMGVGGAAVPAWDCAEPAWFPAEFYWVIGCSYVGLPTEVAPVRNFIGANMSYRKSVFDELGGFVATLGRIGGLPAGCEETEFGIRARRAFPGGRFINDPGSQVRHTVGSERTTWTYFRRRCWSEGRSKAIVSQIAGADEALESERRYVRVTLPRAIVAGLRAGPIGGGWQRALAVIAGLAFTTAGYGYGRIRLAVAR